MKGTSGPQCSVQQPEDNQLLLRSSRLLNLSLQTHTQAQRLCRPLSPRNCSLNTLNGKALPSLSLFLLFILLSHSLSLSLSSVAFLSALVSTLCTSYQFQRMPWSSLGIFTGAHTDAHTGTRHAPLEPSGKGLSDSSSSSGTVRLIAVQTHSLSH